MLEAAQVSFFEPAEHVIVMFYDNNILPQNCTKRWSGIAVFLFFTSPACLSGQGICSKVHVIYHIPDVCGVCLETNCFFFVVIRAPRQSS